MYHVTVVLACHMMLVIAVATSSRPTEGGDEHFGVSETDGVSQQHDDGVTATRRPLRKSATLGSSRILECEVRYPGGVYVQHIVTWRKVGVEAPIFILFDGYPPRMDSSFYGRIRAVGQASIELSDIRMSDEGWYECSVLFLDGSDDVSVNGTWIHLTVNAPPVLVNVSPDVVVRNEGDDVDMFCEARATPNASLTWLKDGRKLASSGHVTVAGNHVVLLGVERSDAGVYSCTFKNVAGTASHLIKLVVHGDGWVASGDIYFVTKPRNATVAEGNRVRLQCRAEGYPENITYRWYRDGVDVQLIPGLMQVRGQVTADGTLVIASVDKDDSGWYKCRATNRVGSSPEAEAYLNVTYLPRVVSMPDHVYLPRGLMGRIDCRVESNPPRTYVAWSKEGRMLDFETVQHAKVNKHGTLILQPVILSDEGQYSCRPYSPLGAGHSSTPVRVFVRDPPYFTLRPNPIYQRRPTQSVEMPCVADGDPRPVISWRKAVGAFPTEVFSSSGNLTVSNLSPDDHGVYECVAASVVSSVITTTLLIIELTSQHPAYNVTAEATRTTVRLSWLPAYDAGYPLHYVVWYRTPHAARSQWNTVRVFSADQLVTSVTLYQLRPNMLYELMVLARRRDGGDALFSEMVSVRTKATGSTLVADPYYTSKPELPHVVNTPSNYDVDDSAAVDAVTDDDRPPTPFNLTVRPIGKGLHVTWSVPTSDRPADYHIVEYRTVGQWVPLTDRLASGLNAYNWTTASRGATYHFRVTGFYDRPADRTSDGAPPSDDRDDEESPLPWQQGLPSAVVTIHTGDPMTGARSGSGFSFGGVGVVAIVGAVVLVAVFFVVQCYRGWQRWSKARQSGGHVLPTTELEQDEQYDNHIESQVDNGRATKVRETPI